MNQYTKANGVTLPSNAYDEDGNLTVAPLPKDQNTNVLYHWDAENRLVKITSLDQTVTIATYSYDYLGRRITKQVDTTPAIYYIYDGWNMIADYTTTIPNSTFQIRNSYTWGMDLSGSMQGAGGVGGLLAVNEFSIINSQLSIVSYYPTYDGNGNVSEYLDSSNAVQAHYEYDAFGNEIVAATSGSLANTFTHRFSTKPLDTETGLYYYGYRYYDPKTGRWPSRDPIEEQGGDNLYVFSYNAPFDWYDYLGQEPKPLSNLDKAGINAVKKALEAQKKSGLDRNGNQKVPEYCGRLCCNKKTGKIKATGPYKGYWANPYGSKPTEPRCNQYQEGGCSQFGADWKDVGGYHTHPSYAYRGLSPKDKELADKENKPEYLGNPAQDYLEKYEPDPEYDSKKEWNNNKGDAIPDNGGGGTTTKLLLNPKS